MLLFPMFDVKHHTQDHHVREALDCVSTAMMIVNRDFIVTYVNRTTKELIRENLEQFRSLWKDVSPDTLVGTCIDVFLKDRSTSESSSVINATSPSKQIYVLARLRFPYLSMRFLTNEGTTLEIRWSGPM